MKKIGVDLSKIFVYKVLSSLSTRKFLTEMIISLFPQQGPLCLQYGGGKKFFAVSELLSGLRLEIGGGVFVVEFDNSFVRIFGRS